MERRSSQIRTVTVTCLNNSFLRCGQGAADDVYTFYFGDDQDLSLTSCRAVLDNNNSDAAEDIKNPESVPLVGTQYPAAAAGGGGLQGATVHRVMVTDAQGNASVSDITKTELDALDGVSSNIQTQLDSAPSTSSNTTFEENLTVKKTFYIQSSDDATFWMSKPGYQIFRQEHKGSYVKFRLGSTAQFYMFDDGRYNFTGTHLQVPTSDDTPSTNAANSKGGIWLDTSEDPPVLRYHDGYQWKTLATT